MGRWGRLSTPRYWTGTATRIMLPNRRVPPGLRRAWPRRGPAEYNHRALTFSNSTLLPRVPPSRKAPIAER